MRSTDYISKGTAVARLYRAREYPLMDRDCGKGLCFYPRSVRISRITPKRLEILEMEIDNQLKEEEYGKD